MPRPSVLPSLLLALCATFAGAQTPPPAPHPAYDVVSVKINKSGSGNMIWKWADNSITMTNLSLGTLLVTAYDIREGLIFGLPGWTDSARFDLNAKILDPDAARKFTPGQRRDMMAVILTERFHLKTHTEVRQLPIYELVVAKDGPRFKEGAPIPTQPDPSAPKNGHSPGGFSSGRGEFTGYTVALSTLVTHLANTLDRTVIDKTNLTGEYDLHLKWTPDDASARPENGSPEDAPPPLFTALQEQLGLKLVSTKGPVTTLVVEHVDLPSEN